MLRYLSHEVAEELITDVYHWSDRKVFASHTIINHVLARIWFRLSLSRVHNLNWTLHYRAIADIVLFVVCNWY